MIFRQLFDEETWTYTYILGDPETKEAAIIDSVDTQIDRDLEVLSQLGLTLKYILDTHVHADHVTGAHLLREKTGAKITLSSEAKIDGVDIPLDDGDTLDLGRHKIKVIATPGHTETCTSYQCEDKIFTGDALLIRGCGRTDFQQGDPAKLFESVRFKLFENPDESFVYPGHDYRGRMVSTIGEEKKYNPRLNLEKSKEQFVEIMNNLNLKHPKKINEAVPLNLKLGNREI